MATPILSRLANYTNGSSSKFGDRAYLKGLLGQAETIEERVIISHVLFPDDSDPRDYLECPETGYRARELTSFVLKIMKRDPQEYKTLHNLTTLKCVNECERVKGDKNPAYQHGGRLSPFSKNFLKGNCVGETVTKAQKTRTSNNNDATRLEYYTSRGMSEEDARVALSQRQTTFSKEKCIQRYGEVEGLKVWERRQ